jgi:hypothetical protein
MVTLFRRWLYEMGVQPFHQFVANRAVFVFELWNIEQQEKGE